MSKQTSISVSKPTSPRYDAAFKRRAAEHVLLQPFAQASDVSQSMTCESANLSSSTCR